MTLEIVFNIANFFVLPFWGCMVLLPRWQGTQRLMDSLIPFVCLAIIYFSLFIYSLDPNQAAIWSNPTLTDLAALFSIPKIMATGWVHYLVMDLFVGRWIYQQGVEKGIVTTHSLILCLFAGPIGLLSHIITAWLTVFFQQKKASVIES